MVIFGAAGDLTRRKLIPALYNLAKTQVLSREFAIIGVARSPMSNDDFRKKLTQDMKQFATEPVDNDLWEWFVKRLYYVSGDFDDKNVYTQLKDLLARVDQEHTTHGNHFYYLATAANYFGAIVEQLSATGLMEENQHWRRVIVEKPFGHDLPSAKQLNKELKEILTEKQIFRIDHYLGKETVQNLMVFRFANSMIEPLWNGTSVVGWDMASYSNVYHPSVAV